MNKPVSYEILLKDLNIEKSTERVETNQLIFGFTNGEQIEERTMDSIEEESKVDNIVYQVICEDFDIDLKDFIVYREKVSAILAAKKYWNWNMADSDYASFEEAFEKV